MKRILITILLIVFLCSCSVTSPQHLNTEQSHQDIIPGYGGDTAFVGTNNLQTVDENFLIVEDKNNNIVLPVIKNLYPMGDGGADFNVNQNIKNIVTENAKKYAAILNIEFNEELWEFDESTAKMQYNTGKGSFITVNPDYITYWCAAHTLNIDSDEKDFLSLINTEPHIKAMYEFLKITNPAVKIEKELDEYGALAVTAIIYQSTKNTADRILNTEFNSINIHITENADYYWINCTFNNIEIAESTEYLKFSDVTDEAKIDTGASYVGYEIKYFSNIKQGYYVPCYVIYNTIENTDNQASSSVKQTIVPMYDIK